MKRGVAAASPDAYIAALDGWRRTQVEALRAAVRAAGALEERIKWGHLVYLHAGPVLLIRAETRGCCSGSGGAHACAKSNRDSSAAARTKWPR